MKTSHRLLLILTALTGIAFLASCTHRVVANSVSALQKSTIKLHVIGNPKELIVKTPGSSNCKAASPANGCVAVGKRDTALITFELKTSPDWNFSEFKICRGSAKDSQDCNLEKWEKAEFFAADAKAFKLIFPNDSGIIDLKQLSNDLTKFYLFDFNSVEQDFFYTIKVCNADSTIPCITTDPTIENKGRN